MNELQKKNEHFSVMKAEVLENLQIQPDGTYIDATLGRGGHTAAILEKLTTGKIYAFDQDPDAINFCSEKFAGNQQIQISKLNFVRISEQINEKVDGILMDLGLSSPQIDNSDRGFSYQNDGNLDMRMDLTQKKTAADVLNEATEPELKQIFSRYGEIKAPQFVVKAILKQRPIQTTKQFVDLIRNALPTKLLFQKNGHPEKVYFQALRIFVNDELNVLNQAIPKLANLLKIGGRLCILTFHSLEEKIVKRNFQMLSKNTLPAEIPLNENWQKFQIIVNGQKPTENEISQNSRSSSAKLFVLKRLKE